MEFRGLKTEVWDLGAEQNAWRPDLSSLTTEAMTREVRSGAATSRSHLSAAQRQRRTKRLLW